MADTTACSEQTPRPTLDPMPHGCNFELNGLMAPPCYLWGGTYLPLGQTYCSECPGHVSALRLHREHLARGGEPLDLRSFIAAGHVTPNDFTRTRAAYQSMLRRAF